MSQCVCTLAYAESRMVSDMWLPDGMLCGQFNARGKDCATFACILLHAHLAKTDTGIVLLPPVSGALCIGEHSNLRPPERVPGL
mmetsp:Transcript_110415/g.191284  ORF Transcript_110415/g.191284 Transcript_110415/m.191284 type:complete len:84 (+) Transcript_110415:2538-2789(+)